MKEWIEHNYIFEDKEVIQKLGLKGETIVEAANTSGKLKITTR